MFYYDDFLLTFSSNISIIVLQILDLILTLRINEVLQFYNGDNTYNLAYQQSQLMNLSISWKEPMQNYLHKKESLKPGHTPQFDLLRHPAALITLLIQTKWTLKFSCFFLIHTSVFCKFQSKYHNGKGFLTSTQWQTGYTHWVM